jgi:capsule polysaccharide export protein KpsC/LpsZ
VLKEHPRSLGRNPLSFLRRLARRSNIRLVDPYASSHELIRRSDAVVVIGSTVGVEALLHGHPVLTLGQPWYGGYGVTVDVDSFREIRDAVLEVLRFRPDRERTLEFLAAAMRSTFPGKPGSLDHAPENVARLAASIEAVARRETQRRALQPA